MTAYHGLVLLGVGTVVVMLMRLVASPIGYGVALPADAVAGVAEYPEFAQTALQSSPGRRLLVGRALLFGSPVLVVYTAGIALRFHVFVVLYKEPTLRRRFGVEYETYCRAVPRWIPRLRPALPQR
jgi:protein-S-isoprenylcysteine O-methyltransferase Ste14